MSKHVTVGGFEIVSLPELGLHDVVAKIDTGAYSGAIHCTNIKVVRRGVRRQPVLSFHPAGEASLVHETVNFIRRNVRSSTGHRVKRYLIKTKIVIDGIAYNAEIGLSDRSTMKKQVLLGRRFLREHKILVDVTQNSQYDDEGELK